MALDRSVELAIARSSGTITLAEMHARLDEMRAGIPDVVGIVVQDDRGVVTAAALCALGFAIIGRLALIQHRRTVERERARADLGLAISIGLARAMGGDLVIGSRDGEGTMAILRMPAAGPSAAPQRLRDREAAWPAGLSVPPAGPRGRPGGRRRSRAPARPGWRPRTP